MHKIHLIDLHFRELERTIASFLVETTAGPVLVETGPHSTLYHLKKGIEGLGYRMEDIKHVFLSHIHLDHAGAAWCFANLGAKIYVHPSGYPHLADPSRLMKSAKRIYQDQMDSLWGQMEAISPENLVQVQNNEKVKIGEASFSAFHTPGHAIHHIAWKLEDSVFTGDVAGVMIKNGVIVPPCPPPDINIEDWNDSIDTLRKLRPRHLYLTHYGRVDHVEEHLNKLENILWDWAKWIKPYSESDQIDQKEVTEKFEEYVKSQLLDAGIKPEEIIQYETANPSWMSVAGLIRYWKKKTQK